MKYIQSSYKGHHDELNLIPIGDLHIGSPHFDEKTLLKQLEWIDQHRENTRIILMGDIAETATKDSVGAGVLEQQETAQQQIYKAKNYFYDFRELIDGIVTGNHEQRIYQRTGIDISEIFAGIMGLSDKYLKYQGVIKYSWNKRAYNVSVFHGAGGGSTPGSAMNRLEKQTSVVFCDLYLAGHTHKRQAHTKTIYVPDERNNRIKPFKQVFVSTGSALTYENSYAEEKGLPPTEMGFPKIILSGRTIQTKKNYSRAKDIKVEI